MFNDKKNEESIKQDDSCTKSILKYIEESSKKSESVFSSSEEKIDKPTRRRAFSVDVNILAKLKMSFYKGKEFLNAERKKTDYEIKLEKKRKNIEKNIFLKIFFLVNFFNVDNDFKDEKEFKAFFSLFYSELQQNILNFKVNKAFLHI